ncbi:BCCT family transporter [Dyella tabacisoli]|uniref:BCCT family transporter n=1 Tax=Dyella tabacisoli TaxID=2282381 RepID=A0A369UVE9_9GAMM|nr:BCCT family transporter [Dyella tabacisoli]RDD82329.1 BCCT family transporter [Dyella tabacisoli]
MSNDSLLAASSRDHRTSGIYYALLVPAMLIVLVACIPLALYPEDGKRIVDSVLAWITQRFGWLFLWTGLGSLPLMAWFAFGPLGRIKFGSADEAPEFGNLSWFAMLFCGGIGISIVNWAFVEPLYIYMSPPLGMDAKTPTAMEWAAMYPMQHWGLVPWALYLLPSLPIGYLLYVRRGKSMRFGEICTGVLPARHRGWLGRVIDIVVILSIVGGVGTSLGLSVPLVSSLIAHQLGAGDGIVLQGTVLTIWLCLIGYSVYSGLNKGIRYLSNINAVLAIAMLLLVLLVGPFTFLMNLASNSMGLLADNFFRINLWTDPLGDGSFPRNWTIFYWAWWIAYCPMMGLFVARISRGRTIRQVVVHGTAWGSLGCIVFFAIWGGYALYLEANGIAPVTATLDKEGISATVILVLSTLPMPKLVLLLFTVLCFVFLATTVDSASYTLASLATREIDGYQQPSRGHRVLWVALLGVVGVGLLSVGGLKAAQISTVIVAVPMIPVLICLALALVRWAREDFGSRISATSLSLPTSVREASQGKFPKPQEET